MQRKIIIEALKNELEISFEDASYNIEEYNTKITIHEKEDRNEVV